MNFEKLFFELFNAKDEDELQQVIESKTAVFGDGNWNPLGDTKGNYGIVKNQQANPVAAMIEKATNSIDAILTKKCHERGMSPTDPKAPRSMDKAIEEFFPDNNWDLQQQRRAQAEDIQIIADGKGPRSQRTNLPTSVIVYDNGEGQHPQDFPKTFLSLIRSNKNNIHFVQGKYNMGGTGAIVFCGKKRYQLIASKRYSNDGEFGFTLIREHPKSAADKGEETWFEYLVVDGQIPSFPIESLDLGLEGRNFKTGTILKLYSYQFPKGISGFAQELRQSVNEYLFSPALPILMKDTAERYPNNKVLSADLFGLKRRLLQEEGEYLEDRFSQDFTDEMFDTMKVSCFVFKTKVKGWDMKKSREEIRNRYFKNGMSVLFSMNGQVHGYYTSEFITRSLKMNMLKNHLLIHVDCTSMKYEFRKELFMASRDRLKDGDETQQLRWFLAKNLSQKDGRLAQIQKRRRQAADIDTSSNTKQLLSDFTKNMPLNNDLMKLLGETFKLDLKKDKPKKGDTPKRPKKEKEEIPFKAERFPSSFKVDGGKDGNVTLAKIPLHGEKTIKFSTDVENDYFDRTDEPGEMKISILTVNTNETEGGTDPGTPKEPTEIFNVVKSSPHEGTIKLTLNPIEELKVGDTIEMKATLTAPGSDFDQIFMVKVVDPTKPKQKAPKPEDDEEPLGLPQLTFAVPNPAPDAKDTVSWEAVQEATSLDMDYKTVMIPEAEGDNLKRIFVNMDSAVLKNFKSKHKNPNEDQITIANRKYFTSVYFHTLFLYTITKNRGYQIERKKEDSDDMEHVDVGTYLKDVFDHYYSTFILNFGGMEEMMQGVGE